MPTPGTSEHSRKHQIYNDTSSSNKLVLSLLPRIPKPQNMPAVSVEHQFIMLENFETIYISKKSDSAFHKPVIHCRFSHIAPFYAKGPVVMGFIFNNFYTTPETFMQLKISPLHTSQSPYESFSY